VLDAGWLGHNILRGPLLGGTAVATALSVVVAVAMSLDSRPGGHPDRPTGSAGANGWFRPGELTATGSPAASATASRRPPASASASPSATAGPSAGQADRGQVERGAPALTTEPTAALGYRLLHVDHLGRAARLNPCAPVPYQVNLAGAPPGAEEDVHEAVRRLGVATRIAFVDRGASTASPTAGRGAARGTDGAYPPVLFAWAPRAGSGVLTDGWSGSDVNWVGTANGPVIVSATVVLDSDHNDDVVEGFSPGLSRGALLLHELGHVAGLADSADPADLMYGQVTEKPADWSRPETAGLLALGATAGCRAAP